MRDYSSALPKDALRTIQRGSLRYTYRDIPFLKNPFDIALYTHLLFQLKPRTVIEIGTHRGGSALWFADLLMNYGVAAHVYSVDVQSSPAISDPRITFMAGDARALSATLTDDFMRSVPRPLLVVEDSAHYYETSLAVLRFFDDYLEPNDYIVIEDGIVRDLPDELYRKYLDGPSRAIAAFLSTNGTRYAIDEHYCDFFGYNFTYNPNGYLRRI
jgi:cephalosporin hydroxylase